MGKLPVPGRPTNFDNSGARAYCACSRCGRGLFGHIFSHLSLFVFFSPSLWETTACYRLKYCLKRPLNPEQPTNQPTKKPIFKTKREKCTIIRLSNVKDMLSVVFSFSNKSNVLVAIFFD